MSSVAKRYARAAVAASLEVEGPTGVEKLAEAVDSFRDAYKASPELRELLRNPQLVSVRDAALTTLLAKIGAGKTATRLVQLLAKNERIDQIDAIADAIENEADQRAGRLRARVKTPMPLSPAHEQRLSKSLEKRFRRPVVVSWSVEPQLLGGLVAQVGDVTLDTSLRHHLERLREQLGANRS